LENEKKNMSGLFLYQNLKADKELHRTGDYTGQAIDPRYLSELVMAVYHNPSKFIDIIIKLME
jgi:hypothetical protein